MEIWGIRIDVFLPLTAELVGASPKAASITITFVVRKIPTNIISKPPFILLTVCKSDEQQSTSYPQHLLFYTGHCDFKMMQARDVKIS